MRVFLLLAVFLAGLSTSSANARPTAHCYLFRGFANVFSMGIDTLGSELAARGCDASVYSNVQAAEAASIALQAQRADGAPVVIIGHSLGGNAAFQMARIMQTQGGKVALIVAFGPTYNDQASANVSRVISYYQPHSVVTGAVSRGPGFRGSLANVNLDSAGDITHFNIDKIARLHAQTIAAVASVSRARVAQAAAPAAAAPEPAAAAPAPSAAATTEPASSATH